MARSKTKPKTISEPSTTVRRKPPASTSNSAKTTSEPSTTVLETPGPAAPDVLTLAEAAAYLRLPEAVVTNLVRDQKLPGRQAGAEWRFLKAAIQDWLRTPAQISNKEGIWAWAGVFKDDTDLEEIVQEAYRRRGRPITEEG